MTDQLRQNLLAELDRADIAERVTRLCQMLNVSVALGGINECFAANVRSRLGMMAVDIAAEDGLAPKVFSRWIRLDTGYLVTQLLAEAHASTDAFDRDTLTKSAQCMLELLGALALLALGRDEKEAAK